MKALLIKTVFFLMAICLSCEMALAFTGGDQAWQKFTAPTRAFNATYQNNTGNPIQAIIMASPPRVGYAAMVLKIGPSSPPSTVVLSRVYYSTEIGCDPISVIIPAGDYYKVETSLGILPFKSWAELR